ncbi:mitotic spindle assembly checkpoint protein MAD1-like isoform X1 [Clavelina lepadiformis]|uniref:mitotic spindle assembly checkpoint protein MAD1-like isoform X1 n=2 Tax=Clavelina lepadiformis TaxID=159417 RepID=UPI004041519A
MDEDKLSVYYTPDNTKVMRIMGDFTNFLDTQRRAAANRSSPFLSSIPFNIAKDETLQETSTEVVKPEAALSNVEMMLKIKNMEAEFESVKKAQVKANIELESKVNQFFSENCHLKEKCDNLQFKVKQLTSKSLELIDETKSAKKEKNDEISKWESSYSQLHKVKQEADDRVANELAMNANKNSQLQEENMNLKSHVNILELRLEEMSSHMEHFTNKINEAQEATHLHQQRETQIQELKRELRELTSRLSEAEDAEKMAKIFKEDLSRLRQLEIEYKRLAEENHKLKENQENAFLLNEKLLLAESKLDRAEERCAKMDNLEATNNNLLARLKSLDNNQSVTSKYNELSSQVLELRHMIEFLEERNATLESEHVILSKKYMTEKQEKTVLDAKLAEQQESSSSLSAQLIRLRKKAGLLAHERDSIRSILQSYDAELTSTSHTTQLSRRLQNSEDANRKLYFRIEQLENELQKSEEQKLFHKLRAKQLGGPEVYPSAGVCPTPSQCMKSENANDSELETLKVKIEEYEKERITMHDKIEHLETWIEQGRIKGDYNPENTKVLHFAMNPSALAHQKSKQDVAQLKADNTELRKKITELQQGHEVSISEVEISRTAKEQIARAELRNQRLKEIFSKKIQEYRQACYSLTGYRIDTSTDSRFKLLSMYAESESDCLLFEMKPDGTMQMLETEFSKSLEDLISLHLHHQNSIPMFLSALSISLFSQQTMMLE